MIHRISFAVARLVSLCGLAASSVPLGEARAQEAGAAVVDRVQAPVQAPQPVIADALAQRLKSAAADESIEVLVWMRPNPAPLLAREIRAQMGEEIEALGQSVRAMRQSLRPSVAVPNESEHLIVYGGTLRTDPRNEAIIDAAIERQEALTEAMYDVVDEEVRAQTAAVRTRVQARIEDLGGAVAHWLLTINAFMARMPAATVAQLATDPDIVWLHEPMKARPELDVTKSSLGLTTGYWANGFNGRGYDVGIIDSGFQQNHPDFGPRDGWVVAPGLGTTDLANPSGHGTAVAGVIFSNHADFRGAIFDLHTPVVGGGTVFDSDGEPLIANTTLHADWMVTTASEDPEVLNGSFSYAIGNGDTVDEIFFDTLADSRSVTTVFSAGNCGPGACVRAPSTSFNALSVAAVNDENDVTRTNDRAAGFSARGPTPSGRKKPDLTAPGVAIHTTNSRWEGVCNLLTDEGCDFKDINGTSFSAPHVTAVAMLVVEQRASDEPTAVKAVLLNSADTWTDAGTSSTTDDGPALRSEWNPVYGWGYLDALEAYFNGLDVFTATIDDANSSARNRYFIGPAFRGDKATLVWNRHGSYNYPQNSTALALTNLDLYLYSGASGGQLESSVSTIDNVEQVACGSTCPATGIPENVVVRVTTVGSLAPGLALETFSLATEEGFNSILPPSMVAEQLQTTPPIAEISPGQAFELQASARNVTGNRLTAPNPTLRFVSGATLVSGTAIQSLNDLAAGAMQTVSWSLRAACATDPRSLDVEARSVAWGQTWSDFAALGYTPSVASMPNGLGVGSSAVPRTYAIPVPTDGTTAVMLLPGATSNLRLAIDSDLCLAGSPLASSALPGGAAEMVVVNGRTLGAATYYTLVAAQGGSGAQGYELYSDSTQAISATGAIIQRLMIPGQNLVEAFELRDVVAGRRYRITVANPTTLDTDLYLYAPSLTAANASGAMARSEAAGLGADEAIEFTATSALPYVAILRWNAGTTSEFRLQVTDITPPAEIFRDGFEP